MRTAHLRRLLSLLTGISLLQQVRCWSITVPKTVSAVEGTCVVVPCQTEPHSRVKWYQYHTIKYPVVYDGLHPHTVENQFRGRASVIGKAAEGNCTLMITDVRRADNNLQVYVWINPDSPSNQKFHDQTVTIYVGRRAPIISMQKPIVDGEMFQANCSVSYSCPSSPPFLHWELNAFLENSTFIAPNEKVQGQMFYTETLRGLATYKMHGSKVSCSAKFSNFKSTSQQITLNVLYKPLTVILMLESEPVIEGGSIIVECVANSNPQPNTYLWLQREMQQNISIHSSEREMIFYNITRDTSLSCIAHNDIGVGQSDWLDLDVHYAPEILAESSCHHTGESLNCVCQAEAYPNASIRWTIDGNDTLPSSFSFVSTNTKNVVSGVVNGPTKRQPNISCTATNSLGSSTKQLSVNLSKTSLLTPLILLFLGVALLSGCAMFIFRKYSRNRPPPSVLCSTAVSCRPPPSVACSTAVSCRAPSSPNKIQQQSLYSGLSRRARVEDTHTDSNPKVDRLSDNDVYDNDLEIEMQPTRPPQEQNTMAHKRQGKIQPLLQDMYGNMGDLDC